MSFEKRLGIATLAFLVLLVVVMGWWLGISSGADKALFILMFQVASLLNVFVLYWPYRMNNATEHPAASALLVLNGAGLFIVITYLNLASRVPESFHGLTTLLEEYATFLFFASVGVLVLTFFATTTLLLLFLRRWLASLWAHVIGLSWFLLFAVSSITYGSGSDLFVSIGSMLTGNHGVGHRPFIPIYILFHGIMLFFFCACFGYYLASLFSRKTFSVSRWMHVVYFYLGVSGSTGIFATAFYEFAYP